MRPVSYTHLDVYKRQIPLQFSEFMALPRILRKSVRVSGFSCGELPITSIVLCDERSVIVPRNCAVGAPVKQRMIVDFPALRPPMMAMNGFLLSFGMAMIS